MESRSLGSAIVAQSPLVVGQLRLELKEPRSVEGGEKIDARLELRAEDGSLRDVKEQEVYLPATLEAERAIAEARSRLAEDDFQAFDCLPHELFAERHPFVRVALPGPDAPHFAQAIAIPIHEQAWEPEFANRFARIRHWPVAARTLYFMWEASSSFGSSGIGAFLSQARPREVVAMMDALDEAGLTRLASLYRRAVDVVEGGGDPSSEIDGHHEGGTYWLLQHELEPAFDVYARALVATLCGDIATPM